MDWKRIKTILIIALLFINIILFYTLYQDNLMDKEIALDVNDVLGILEDEAIHVSKELLDVDMMIPDLSLALQIYDVAFSEAVFEEASPYKDNEVITPITSVKQGKELSFETPVDRFDEPKLSDAEIEVLANQLILDLGLSLEDIYLKEIGHTNKKAILVYGQKVGGHVVRDAYMIIKYNNDNLLEFSRVWYEVVSSETTQKEFYKPEYALYKFLREVYIRFPNRKRPLEVTHIELAYQLRQKDETPSLDNLVVEGSPSIFWQITTSDGEDYLIETTID